MKAVLITGVILLLCYINPLSAQNQWMPDTGAYEYLTKGNNPEQFIPSELTSVSADPGIPFNSHPSIKWEIPANSGVSRLNLITGDKDFRNKVIYTNCRRNSLSALIYINLVATDGSLFRIGPTTLDSSHEVVLPETEWQQLGGFSEARPLNGANIASLQHIKWISFVSNNSFIDMTLWIGEIKILSPTGPACIVHFNRYRDLADSLLTPHLLQKNIRANIDFNFEFAKNQSIESYSAVSFQAIGLNRIDSLVRFNNWSCTSHGSFYDQLTYLSPAERYRLYSLDSFIVHGFDAQWCFSIPKDEINPSILKEIKLWNFYKSIRKQAQSINQLPIDNPDRLLFFKPTSASAGPNLNGTPLSLSEMKHYVDSVNRIKGLIILDFGTIVTVSSTLYTDIETTMLSDAIALIDYVDSLNISFINFKELFDVDPSYTNNLRANDDFILLSDTFVILLPVLSNDISPGANKYMSSVNVLPAHGSISITTNGDSLMYKPSGCFDYDIFSYILTDGINSDTASITVKRVDLNIHAVHTGFCSPNTYDLQVMFKGETTPKTYMWSNGGNTAFTTGIGGLSYSVTVTDSIGCIITDSITLSIRLAPQPFVSNSIQCGPGIPTCSAFSVESINWYDSISGGNLLQSGGSTYTSTINSTTTFYVEANYGNCASLRVPITATVNKPYSEIDIAGDSVLCHGQPYARFVAVCDPGMTYQWYLENIPVQGAVDHRYFARVTGNYYLEITRPEDNCKEISSVVQLLDLDSFNISTVGDSHFCNGDSVRLISPVQFNGLAFQWYRNNILLNGSTANSLVVYDQATYNLEITKSPGCNGFSDTAYTIVDCTVGINESYNDLLKATIYPNPNNGYSKLRIENSVKQNIEVSISDLNGRVIKTVFMGIIDHGKTELNIQLENITAGIYICSINTSQGTLQKKLFVTTNQ